jgi:indole-3-glycerol phosphate synthase
MTAKLAQSENFLDRMAESSRARVQAASKVESIGAMTLRARADPKPLPLKLSSFDLIAELKLRSPAAGGLAEASFDTDAQLDAYAAGGAGAVSVLTEPTEFMGDLTHLEKAAARLRRSDCPVMRAAYC